MDLDPLPYHQPPDGEAFPLFAKWGVAGVKIDFVERDDQEGIAFYYRAAAKAAEHRLMVDFHGSTKPWGLERTYPNVLGYEGVIGMERSRTGSRDDPELHVMLPFTRMLAGQNRDGSFATSSTPWRWSPSASARF